MRIDIDGAGGLLAVLLTMLLGACTVPAGDGTKAGEADWVPLFNGNDLDGWVEVNGAPDTFTVRDGMIVCSGKPICVLRTDRHYENFELELEWRHMQEKGNAGLFLWSDPLTAKGQPFTRSIEVQILDGRNTPDYTSHGDVFAIHGARMTPDRPHPSGWMRCLPSEWRSRPAGEWNHYRVTCRDGVISLAVNGAVVSGGSECSPRKGYICLESEGSEVHFRNLRLRELPPGPSPAAGDEVAGAARGFRTLYTGVDLSGWRLTPEQREHWEVRDWVLAADGEGGPLWTEALFGDFELKVDWREPAPATEERPAGTSVPLRLRGAGGAVLAGPLAPAGEWNRIELTLRGDRLGAVLNGATLLDGVLEGAGFAVRGPGAIGLDPSGRLLEFANLYVRPLPPSPDGREDG